MFKFILPMGFILSALFHFNATATEWTETTDTPSAQEFCTEIHDQQDQLRRIPRWTLIRDALRLIFAPGKLVKLHGTEIKIEDSGRVELKPQAEQNSSGRNIIFAIQPPDELNDSATIAQMRQESIAVKAEIARLTPPLLNVVGAPSIDSCVSRIQSTHFDLVAFTELNDRRNALWVIDQIDEARVASRIIAKTLKHLKLDWEVVASTDLMAVHQLLQDPTVENVVMFSHGLSNGKLVDSRMNEYPLGFFSHLSPSIRSITLFACHGEEIAENYLLNQNLKVQPSLYSARFTFVSDGSTLDGKNELVPVKSFPAFMRKVDHALRFAKNKSWNEKPMGPLYQAPAQCELKLKNFKVSQGAFAFSLNGYFLGSIHSKDSESSIRYPCDFADRKMNILTNHGINLMNVSTLESLDFELLPIHPGYSIKDPVLTHYCHADQSYMSSKLQFELVPNLSIH